MWPLKYQMKKKDNCYQNILHDDIDKLPCYFMCSLSFSKLALFMGNSATYIRVMESMHTTATDNHTIIEVVNIVFGNFYGTKEKI